MFTRAKARKPRASISKPTSRPEESLPAKEDNRYREAHNGKHTSEEHELKEPPKKRRNKLSFSTPSAPAEKPVRRSKRLSDEAERRNGSPQPKARQKHEVQVEESRKAEEIKRPPERQKTPLRPQSNEDEDHSATKIALPFADTPVIRKNKAMREGKSGKGERRNSLGLRGRRASSLIESGISNGEQTKILWLEIGQALMMKIALPHSEVEVVNFYKHIESEGLPEPRRMRQLLTWCATRAMGEQPGESHHAHSGYEDHSARLAGEYS